MSERWVLGFDVGGTKTSVLAGSFSGTVLYRESFPSKAHEGFESMWPTMRRIGDDVVARMRHSPEVIGVSIGGPLDSRAGIVLSPPNLPGWDHIPLGQLLTQRFGVVAYVEHDAKAGALAEWYFGAARASRNVVFLTFGTGLGAGLILDGRLYRGSLDNAGEVGNWRMATAGPLAYGKHGSWEAFCSGAGLPRLAERMYPGAWPGGTTAQTLIREALRGERRAQSVIDCSAKYLGKGIALLVDLLNPEVVVLGSLAVRAGDLFLPTARRIVHRECTPRNQGCRIVASELGDRIGDVAAVCAALYRIGALPAMP